MVKFADEAGGKSSFGVQMSTPFRCDATRILPKVFMAFKGLHNVENQTELAMLEVEVLPSLAPASDEPVLEFQQVKLLCSESRNYCTAQAPETAPGCRDAPLPADGDIDGALEQMSSFADQSVQTPADEELYSSSLTGQHAPRLSPRGQEKVPSSPQVTSLLHIVVQ